MINGSSSIYFRVRVKKSVAKSFTKSALLSKYRQTGVAMVLWLFMLKISI